MINSTNAKKAIANLSIKIDKSHWRQSGLAKYVLIMNRRNSSVFFKEDETLFISLFNDFYGLTGHGYEKQSFQQPYYEIFKEVYKNSDGKKRSISYVLNEIYTRCRKNGEQTVELSYASKMLHTLEPDNFPIWDSVLIPRKKYDNDGNPIPQHFADSAFGGIKNKKFKDITKAVEEYDKYVAAFNKYMGDNSLTPYLGGKRIIEMFKKVFPRTGISEIKMIDFVLWQDR